MFFSATTAKRILGKYPPAIATFLTLIATARIVATYQEFSFTTDEPLHIACGMEWLQHGKYHYDDQHPPLSRVMAAVLPYLIGVRSRHLHHLEEEGISIVGKFDEYPNRLTLARLGILPFFWLACYVLYIWARKSFGDQTAVLALLFFTGLPAILGHSGLATTDMALVAGLGSAVVALMCWFEKPDYRPTMILGSCGAIALLAKFSSLPFFAGSVVAIAVGLLVGKWTRLRKVTIVHLKTAGVACLVAALLTWAGYRFSFGQFKSTSIVGPAPEFYNGLKTVRYHNRAGHLSYLLGEFSENGFKHYYPVALGVKTPIPFLILTLIGTLVAFRRWRESQYWIPLANSFAVLAIAMVYSHINIGIRHVLPLYIFFSILAALGTVTLFQRVWSARIGAGLIIWFVVGPIIAHPDYLSYFNEAAGQNPERILIDSDLDWRQDSRRLNRRLHELGVTQVSIAGAGALPKDISVGPLSLDRITPGWNAGGITSLMLMKGERKTVEQGRRYWFEEIPPTEHIGKGVFLWYSDPRTPLDSDAGCVPASAINCR